MHLEGDQVVKGSLLDERNPKIMDATVGTVGTALQNSQNQPKVSNSKSIENHGYVTSNSNPKTGLQEPPTTQTCLTPQAFHTGNNDASKNI